MGIFTRERRSWADWAADAADTRSIENPARPLTAASLVDVFSRGPASYTGVTVNEESALRVTAVWRAISILSGLAAQLPLKVYRPATPPGASREEIPWPLMDDPHPELTSFELVEQIMVALLTVGNSFTLLVPNELGEIIRLRPIDPRSVTVKIGSATPENPSGKVFDVASSVGTVTLTPDDLLHIPGMGFNGLVGLSPIQMARQPLGLALAHEEYGARFFGQGALMGGVLTTDVELTREQAEATRQRWAEIQGLGKAHAIAVLDRAVKYVPTSLSPEDSQYIEGRHFQVEEIARLYGVPNWLLNDASGSTSWGSGLSEQSRGLLIYTLAPYLKRIEKRLARALLAPPLFCEFVVDGLLRSSTQERYNAYATAIAAGFMVPNEARALENWAPLPDEEPTPEVDTDDLEPSDGD